MAEPFTIYKLTILYMLNKAGFPLSNTQISNFFLDQEYTDYFRVQEVLGDLVDTELIQARSTHSNTQYSITAAGKETLGFFKDKSKIERPYCKIGRKEAGICCIECTENCRN